MTNRILSKEVVGIVSSAYKDDNYPSFEKLEDIGEDHDEIVAERTYISPERIQRMPPEEVVDYLANGFSKEYHVTDCDSLIHVLSAATGRTEDELRNAIFGIGDFDAKKFYQPTEKQKVIMKAVFSIHDRLQKVHINWLDYDHWTQDCKDDWDKVLEDVSTEALPSEMKEVSEYIDYYVKHGVPSWLY